MNQQTAQIKISLYRKLNERDQSFRMRDFENYNELFTNEKLNQFEGILSQYEPKIFNAVIESDYEFRHYYSATYLNSSLAIKVNEGYKLHFEFTDILFYELLNFYKNGIEHFIEVLSQRFEFYKTENIYQIPYNSYQQFFSELENDEIKDSIKFLVSTVTNTIITDDNLFTTTIDIELVKRYLDNLKKYNFQ